MESYQRTTPGRRPRKNRKADAKVRSSGHYFQIFREVFFISPRRALPAKGERENGVPKNGQHANPSRLSSESGCKSSGEKQKNQTSEGKNQGIFENNPQMAGNQDTENGKKGGEKGKGERRDTLYIIRARERPDRKTLPKWKKEWQDFASKGATDCQQEGKKLPTEGREKKAEVEKREAEGMKKKN